MEDIRNYQIEEDDRDDERVDFNAAGAEDEVPFHIPRD
jgi:hypothetical protein